jgi:hypothetical protein
MGAVGYLVKLSQFLRTISDTHVQVTDFTALVHIPVNNILVGGA